MVVSRFKPEDPQHKHGAGVILDGWHYELLGCNLPADAWPAAMAVSLYYGRSELENRFGQENREPGLDRLFSHNLAGQAFATLVGMYLWNRRTCNGGQVADIQPDVVFGAHGHVATRPAGSTELPEAQAAALLAKPDAQPRGGSQPDCAPDPQPDGLEAAQRPAVAAPTPAVEVHANAAVIDLDTLDWERPLRLHPGWTRTAENRLQCPQGQTLRLHRRWPARTGGVTLVFRAGKTACRACPLREACTSSTAPDFRKEINLPLRAPGVAPGPAATAPSPPVADAQQAEQPEVGSRPPASPPPGTRPFQPPRLVPSELRHLWTKLAHDIETHIHLTVPPDLPAPPPWLAPAAKRQRRRHTFTERRARLELPDAATVRVEFRRVVRGPGHQALACVAGALVWAPGLHKYTLRLASSCSHGPPWSGDAAPQGGLANAPTNSDRFFTCKAYGDRRTPPASGQRPPATPHQVPYAAAGCKRCHPAGSVQRKDGRGSRGRGLGPHPLVAEEAKRLFSCQGRRMRFAPR